MIPINEILETGKGIDAIVIESGGRIMGEVLAQFLQGCGHKYNPLCIKPTKSGISNRKVERVAGNMQPSNIAMVCDDGVETGGTLKVVLPYLQAQGYKYIFGYFGDPTQGAVSIDENNLRKLNLPIHMAFIPEYPYLCEKFDIRQHTMQFKGRTLAVVETKVTTSAGTQALWAWIPGEMQKATCGDYTFTDVQRITSLAEQDEIGMYLRNLKPITRIDM